MPALDDRELDNRQRVAKNSVAHMQWIRRLPEAPVTLVLIAVNLIVYAAMAASSRHLFFFDSETLISAGASLPQPRTTNWCWLTAAFIHANLPHIALNLLVLAQIGVLSEQAIGRGLFAAAYVVTGVFGNILSSTLAPVQAPSAGASGAIMGLIGLATVFAWRTGQRRIARALFLNILFVLALGFSLTKTGVVSVDNKAHIGGLIVGALLGLVRARVTRPLPRALEVALVAVALALTAVAFVVVRAHGGTRNLPALDVDSA
jgi:rhomboid protease GluP